MPQYAAPKLPGDPARAGYPKKCAGGCGKNLRHPEDRVGDWPGTIKEQSGGECTACKKRYGTGTVEKITNDPDGKLKAKRLAAAFREAEIIRYSRQMRGVRPQGGYFPDRVMAG